MTAAVWAPYLRPAGQAAAWAPTSPERRDLVRACAADPAIQDTTNCDDAMAFVRSNCRPVNGRWWCTAPSGQSYPLEEYLAATYGAPTSGPLPPVTFPSTAPAPSSAPPPASPPPDGRLHPNDVELAALRAQAVQQATTIRQLQIALGVALLTGPVLGLVGYLAHGRRRA